MGTTNIVVDTVTEVNYIFTLGAVPSEITPFLEQNGPVVIDK